MTIRVQICGGSDCVKKKNRYRKLLALFSGIQPVEKMKCQDLCKGPVVLITLSEEHFWFQKLRDKKSRKQLLRFAQDGTLGGALGKRLVRRLPAKSKVKRLLKSAKKSNKRLAPEQHSGSLHRGDRELLQG